MAVKQGGRRQIESFTAGTRSTLAVLLTRGNTRQCLAHAVDTFGSRTNANAWLNKQNRVFHNQSPLQILTEDPDAVEEELSESIMACSFDRLPSDPQQSTPTTSLERAVSRPLGDAIAKALASSTRPQHPALALTEVLAHIRRQRVPLDYRTRHHRDTGHGSSRRATPEEALAASSNPPVPVVSGAFGGCSAGAERSDAIPGHGVSQPGSSTSSRSASTRDCLACADRSLAMIAPD